MKAATCVVLGLLVAGCSSAAPDGGSTPAPPASTGPATTPSCPAPMTATPAGCDYVVAASCAPGTKPHLGDTSCEPVGNTECAAGFARDASGWGCAPVLPSASCTGATRAALGETSCVAIGTCAALPATSATTIVVDASVAEDASHAHTIAGAIAKAPAGGTIAVAAGTYTERLTVDKPLTIQGTCAAQVTLAAPDDKAPGITVTANAKDSVVRGLRFTGHAQAIAVEDDGRARVEDVLVENGRAGGVRVGLRANVVVATSAIRNVGARASDGTLGNGVLVDSYGRVEIHDAEITATTEGAVRFEKNATGVVDRAVLADTAPLENGRGGFGVMSLGGVDVSVTKSAVLRNTETGVLAERYPGQNKAGVSLEDTVVADTIPWSSSLDGSGSLAGWNVLGRGGDVTVRRSTVARAYAPSVLGGQGATVTIERSTIREALAKGTAGDDLVGVQDGTLTVRGSALVGMAKNGILAAGKSTASVEDSLVADGKAPNKKAGGGAVEADGGAQISVKRSALLRFSGFGVRVAPLVGYPQGGTAIVEDTIVGDARGYDDGFFGRGLTNEKGDIQLRGSLVYGAREAAVVAMDHVAVERSVMRDTQPNAKGLGGRGVQVQEGAHVDVTDCVVRNNHDAGIFVGQASSSAHVERTVISETAFNVAQGGFGHGVFVMLSARAELVDTRIEKNPGIGLVAYDASASIEGGALVANGVGVHAAGGTTIVTSDDASSLGDHQLIVTSGTSFDGNGARTGSGEIPLPNVDPSR